MLYNLCLNLCVVAYTERRNHGLLLKVGMLKDDCNEKGKKFYGS